VLGSGPIAGEREVDAAVRAGRRAFPAWKRLGADRRRRILFDIARLLQERADAFRHVAALETGTPLSIASVNSAVDQFEYYGGYADKFRGDLVASYPRRAHDYVTYEPYGVVGALITWNGPITNAAMKLAPALAAGNCVVLKSPELGPHAGMLLAQVCRDAGLPDGVLSVLTGDARTGEAIIRHPDVAKVSFTGGPRTARSVMAVAAETLTPVVLELGGKSANIVLPDADLEQAAAMASRMGGVVTSGQGCLYPTRLLVHDSIHDEMVDRVRATSESTAIGDPLDPSTIMGPVISQDSCERIMGYIGRAEQVATRVTGGERLSGDLSDGYFIRPTVFTDVENDSELAQEEVFGPVLAIIRFSSEDEAVAMANDTRYGLAAYVHTQDLARAHRMADDLVAGYIGVNAFPAMTASAPFGGTRDSGFGREGGRAGIEEYVHHKNVYIPLE
jgi:aldehyde dehydrogenase (NAD+)